MRRRLWDAPPELVEEVQQKRNMRRRVLLFRLRPRESDDTLSVRGQVIRRVDPGNPNAPVAPDPGRSGTEGIAIHGISRHHNAAGGLLKEDLLGGARPARKLAAA